ncbi:hypothetical protein A2U01_0061300 [Trifolium medium]|uniref:Uncharacterized protein n=1 Tax=Trifolium medium TaxID=97028 RepID=A0A392RTV1_9FABA|nr:hypothetical protein [Trifolium medium]
MINTRGMQRKHHLEIDGWRVKRRRLRLLGISQDRPSSESASTPFSRFARVLLPLHRLFAKANERNKEALIWCINGQTLL